MKKHLKNILSKPIKLIFIFMNITEKKYKLTKMGVNTYYLELRFILRNIFQPQKLMKKVILTEILFLRRKEKKHQKKKLVVNLLELITSKEGYDADYDVSRIETFINNFKNIQLKKSEKKSNK